MSASLALGGFQHEPLHTTALCLLLAGLDGAALAGRIWDLPVAAVLEVQLEKRAPTGSGIADLGCRVRLRDGQEVDAIVETKVDSAYTWDQLATMSDGDRVPATLLALGTTGFVIDSNTIPAPWRRLRLREWLPIVERAESTLLRPYVDLLRVEDARQLAAERAAEAGDRANDGTRRGAELVDFAWLTSIRRKRPIRQPSFVWCSRQPRSGPILGWLPTGWGPDGDNVWLQLMCTAADRRLCVQVAGPFDVMLERATALAAALREPWRRGRRPSRAHRSCTAAWIDCSGLTPEQAAKIVDEARAVLDPVVDDLLPQAT